MSPSSYTPLPPEGNPVMRESIVSTSEGSYAELKRMLRAEGLFRLQWRYYAVK